MGSDKRSGNHVVAQKDALNLYFEALLREEVQQDLPPYAEAEESRTAIAAPPVIAIPQIPDVETKSVVDVPLAEVEPEVVTQLAQRVPARQLPPGVPEWAAEPFQALLFKVSGLTLAVPLSLLSGVQEWEEGSVTPMLGRIEWYLGLMTYRGRQVPVVDTAQLVLPADRLENLVTDDMERMGHVVFIQDGHWGLACDSVEEVISLNYEQVKWRSSRTKRRWLAGTVLEQMCAIIDPPGFAEMLRTGIADLPDAEEEATTDG